MKREELSGMKVLDAAFKNLVKCVGLSLQDGKKSFSAMILLFFFPRVSSAYDTLVQETQS